MRLGAKSSVIRKASILLVFCGLLVGTTAGCDAEVDAVLVDGLNSAAVTTATTLIDAAFLSITPDLTAAYNNNTGGTPTIN